MRTGGLMPGLTTVRRTGRPLHRIYRERRGTISIKQNKEMIQNLSPSEYPYLAKELQSGNRKTMMRVLHLIYQEYENSGHKNLRITISGQRVSSLYFQTYGLYMDRQKARKILSYLCALGLLTKAKKKDNKVNIYRIEDLTKPKILKLANKRAKLLQDNKISIVNFTHKRLSDLGITTTSHAGKPKTLAETAFPSYEPTEHAKKSDKKNLRRLMKTIQGIIEEKGYSHKREALNRCEALIREYSPEISSPKAYTEALFNNYRATISKTYEYRAPTEQEKKLLNIRLNNWVLVPVRKKKVCPISDLKIVQNYALSCGLTDEIRQIYTSSRAKRPNKKIRSFFQESYFLSKSGTLYRLDGQEVTEIEAQFNEQGRPYYQQSFIKGVTGRQKIYTYKLIYIAFSEGWASEEASKVLNHSKGDTRPYHERFLSLQVHHIDGHRGNNSPENLYLLTREEHQELHAKERKQNDRTRDFTGGQGVLRESNDRLCGISATQ